MPRISMRKEDREKYGGPEWYELETADILNEETGVLEQIEEEWGMSPKEFLYASMRGTVKGVRALIWAARWKQGFKDDTRTFRPRTQEFSGVRVEATARETKLAEEREVGPPAGRAAKSARKSTAASKTSSTSTGSGSSGS